MVSGLVTSPCDQLRIFSGEARLIRMLSKSVIVWPRSNGFERYKVSSLLVLATGALFPCCGPANRPSLTAFFVPDGAKGGHIRRQLFGASGERRIVRRRNASIGRDWSRYFLFGLDQFHIEAERLQLANQNVEGFRHARFNGGFALHNGLVNLRTAIDVVRLRGEQLLQDVRRTVGFQRPDFHFAEALSAELRLAAQRLLGDERVRSDGASVNLVVHQVRELEHVDVADRDGLIELVAGHAVEEIDLASMRQTSDFEQMANFGFAGTIENRRGEWNAFTEALGVLEQLVVAELAEGLPDRGIGEDFAEPAAERFGARFLA